MAPINDAIAEEGLLLNNRIGKVLNGFRQVRILLETVGNCSQYFLVDMISTVTKSLLCSTVGGNGAWGGETNSGCRRAGWRRDGSEDSVEEDVRSCPFGLGLLWCVFFIQMNKSEAEHLSSEERHSLTVYNHLENTLNSVNMFLNSCFL